MRDYSLTVVDECAISGKLAVGDDQPMQHGKPTQHDLSTVYTVYTVYSYTVLYSKLFFPIHPGRSSRQRRHDIHLQYCAVYTVYSIYTRRACAPDEDVLK